jgi:hypothetical protein
VIAEDRVDASVSQETDNLVREAVLVDAVAEADQLVDIPEDLERLEQPRFVAVHIGNDADLQKPLRQAMMFIILGRLTRIPEC